MCANLITSMGKALLKGKLSIGTLTGLERVLLSQFALPDRVPTLLAATNIEPYLIDERYNYVLLSESREANLALFAKVKERFDFDSVVVPVWMGLLTVGAAELGTKFHIEEKRVPYPVEYPIKGMDDVRRMAVPEKATGYLKMYFDINREAQQRLQDTLIFPVFDGPWDLAMLLRGDQHLPTDFSLYIDYAETEDPRRKEKIRQQGDRGCRRDQSQCTGRRDIRPARPERRRQNNHHPNAHRPDRPHRGSAATCLTSV